MTKIDPQILRVSRIHEFQQVTLPAWVFEPGSSFFIDLVCGEYDALISGARNAGGKSFADSISVEDVADPEGHLITFASPGAPTLCRHVLICLRPRFRYFTAEVSASSSLMLCEIREDGARRNHGNLSNSAKAFIAGVRGILKSDNSEAGKRGVE